MQPSSHGGDTHLNQITKPNANTARYAVIRCYQPARVERELLAQVFELVGRSRDEHFEPSDDG